MGRRIFKYYELRNNGKREYIGEIKTESNRVISQRSGLQYQLESEIMMP